MSNCLGSLKSALEVERSLRTYYFTPFFPPVCAWITRQPPKQTNHKFSIPVHARQKSLYGLSLSLPKRNGSNSLLRQVCKIELKFYLHDEDCEDCEKCVLAIITTEKKKRINVLMNLKYCFPFDSFPLLYYAGA